MRYLYVFVSMGTIFASFSGCVVQEREYPHHVHHERVYVEREPVVEERVEIR